MKECKFIFIFGGVYSSLGKGITASSITRILRELGNKVSMAKFEPYLNVNPGLMSPYQHGEVYVTYDKGETDLDLGSYERIGGIRVSKNNYITSGSVYQEIINKERDGYYGGKTVQVVPHVTGKFKERLYDIVEKEKPDFCVVEIGGTIGDIESLAIVEAICEIKKEVGRERFLPILCAPLILLGGTTGELKTKPCQHAYRELCNLGIQSEMVILRSEVDITTDVIEKMAIHCHIQSDYVFVNKTLPSVYFLPTELYKQGLHNSIYKYFGLKLSSSNNLNAWNNYISKIKKINKQITIAMVGKYMELHDAYASVIEALRLGGWECGVNVNIKWIQSDPIVRSNVKTFLNGVDGIIVPGGFGGRGTDGILEVIRYARINKIPYLGICYGMQLSAIEFARNVLGWKDANTTEIDPKTKHPIFDYIDGRMRLGEEKCIIEDKNTLAYKMYKNKIVLERHRHRWEFNNDYLEIFKKNGYVISAHSNDEKHTAEMAEIKNHPFFFGGQFHPEFSSKPNNNDPCFIGLIKAAIKFHK
ncbi:MAG: CTP synthase [Mycoplasmataceae bacterium]|nr:CTP synthase [Mycoplasmataceae bacterium]